MFRADPPVMARGHGRLAGFCYLMTIGAGLFAEIGTRSAVIVQGDAQATTANIMANPLLYRAGEAADIVMLCLYLAVTCLLYGLFLRGGRQLSMLAVLFSMTGIAILAVDGIFHLAPVALIDAGFPPAERDRLIALSLDLHGDLYGVSLIFFGLYCILVGWLAIRSRQVPWPVGALMMVGGFCHLLTKMAAIVSPDIAQHLPRLIHMAPLIGESVLALWLLLFAAPACGPEDRPAEAR